MVGAAIDIDAASLKPTNVPPQLPENHRVLVPDPPTAVSIILPPELAHKLFLSTEILVGLTGKLPHD